MSIKDKASIWTKTMINRIKNNSTISIIVLAIVITALPLTVFIAQQQQNLRQNADYGDNSSGTDNSNNNSSSDQSYNGQYSTQYTTQYTTQYSTQYTSQNPTTYAITVAATEQCSSGSTLTFTFSSNAPSPTFYHLDRDGTYLGSAPGNAPTMTIGVTAGQAHTYTARVQTAAGTFGASNSLSLTPCNTPTTGPTPTTAAVSCSPRPQVQVTNALTSPGLITTTIAATGANNTLKSINFTAENVKITVGNQTDKTGTFLYTLPTPAVSLSFTQAQVTDCQAGQAVMTVVDACGNWETFAGSGPNGWGTCNGMNMTYTLNLNGVGTGNNTNPLHKDRTVSIVLTEIATQQDTNTESTATFDPATQTFKGTASVANLPAGEYLFRAKTDQYLRKLAGSSVALATGTTATVVPMTLVAGDINNDNVINILDYNILVNCFGAKSTSTACGGRKDAADLNDDGQVEGVDLNIFIKNIGSQAGK